MNQKIDDTKNFTEGSIVKKLILFCLPILLAMFLQAAYGAADLLIVGQFGDKCDVSGVSTGAQVMHTVTNVMCCFATGTTILLGIKLGKKEAKDAAQVVGTTIILFGIIAICLTALMMGIANPFSRLMNAPEEAFSQTVNYVRICSGGLIFIIAYNVLGSVCRGIGDSKTPLITVAISATINVGLDLLFVAVLKMGTSGAAIATVISQAISVFITLIIISKSKHSTFNFKLTKSDFKLDKIYAKTIVKLGTPIAFQELLVGISFLVIIAIVNNFGVDQSAGIGVAEKLVAFIMLPASAFSQAIAAFVAQNIGAKNYQRAKKALFTGIGLSLCCAAFMFYISMFHGISLASIFSKDYDVNVQAASYLKAYAIDTLFTAFMFCFVGFFNGCGKTKFVMIQGVISAFFVRIPVSYIMSKQENVTLFKIGLATPASTFLQIIMCLVYFYFVNKQLKANTIKEVI